MIALRNLFRNMARSLVTLMGISVAIGIFVIIASLTADLRAQIDNVIEAYDTGLLIQSRRAATPLHSRISAAEVDALQAHLGTPVAPLMLGAVREAWSPYIWLFGMPPELLAGIPLLNGEGLGSGGGQVLLGVLAATSLGVEAGDSVVLGGDERPVSGVFRTGSRLLDAASVMEIDEARRILGRENGEAHYNLVVVQGMLPDDTDRSAERIMREFPHLRATSGADFVGSLQIFRSVEAFTRVIALIALLGGALVLANTLLMALSERTREIGVLMSIGWRPRMVLRLLLVESLILCLIGAMVGNLLAVGGLRWLNGLGAFGFGWIPVHVDVGAFLLSLIVSLAIAVVAMIWPAVVLLRFQPAEILRHG